MSLLSLARAVVEKMDVVNVGSASEPQIRAFSRPPGELASWLVTPEMVQACRDCVNGHARWRHRMTQGTYVELARGRMQCAPPLHCDRGCLPHMEAVVIYQSEADGSVWVRPVTEFADGRFERVSP